MSHLHRAELRHNGVPVVLTTLERASADAVAAGVPLPVLKVRRHDRPDKGLPAEPLKVEVQMGALYGIHYFSLIEKNVLLSFGSQYQGFFSESVVRYTLHYMEHYLEQLP